MNSGQPSAESAIRRVYGRRQGRPLKAGRLSVIENLLPTLQVPPGRVTQQQNLSGRELFVNDNPVWLEIGFGNGEHLSGLMENHPGQNFLGAEPFINGMAAFLKDIEPRDLKNVRVWMDDALQLVHSLGDGAIEGIYILNPDPWPKKRHHKRRIVSRENLDAFARVIRPGGSLILATDVDDLAEWMLEKTFLHPAFIWTAESSRDWQTPPRNWIETRYEAKGRECGRRQTYLIFSRK